MKAKPARYVVFICSALLLSSGASSSALSAEGAYPGLGSLQMPGGYGLGICLWSPEKPAPSLRMFLRGGKLPGGHNSIRNYQPLVVGEISLPGAKGLRVKTVEAGPAHRTYLLAGKDSNGGSVRATVTRLSPALLLELGGRTVDLFAGDKTKRWVWGERGHGGVGIEGFGAWYPYPYPVQLAAPGVPRRFAVSNGRSVRQGTFGDGEESLSGAEKGWMLLWYGAGSWFMAGKTSGNFVEGRERSKRLHAGDVPFLLVFSQAPRVAVTGSPSAKSKGTGDALRFSFPRKGAKAVLLPLFGYRFLDAKETEGWTGALPDGVRKKCDWWAAHLAEFPVRARETLSYDSKADAAIVREEFEFTRVRKGGARFAPLPPMLELARAHGFPARVSAAVKSTGHVTYCGPYAGVENSSGYTVTIKGMGRYALEGRTVKPAPTRRNEAMAAARRELAAEVDRMLSAGHLAPVNIPWKFSWNWGAFNFTSVRHVYFSPGQTIRTLAGAYPLLDAGRKAKVCQYMTAEREKYPPEAVPHLPSAEGARREPWRLTEQFIKTDTNKLRNDNFHVKNRIVPAEALYDLAAYYSVLGVRRLKDDGFSIDEALETTLGPWLARRDWATLGWFSWPLEQRDPQYYAAYGWNMTREANRQVAALIGLVRLARMAGEKEEEWRAEALLARTLAHRFALGKYVAWLHREGMLDTPAGYDPSLDFREVAVSEQAALPGYGLNQHGLLPFFTDVEGPMSCMVPELARFFADYLRPECESFARESALFYPDAFLAYGTPRRSAEWWHNYPQDGRQVFMTHAWVLGEKGDWLYRHLDVPWTRVGDLYHVEKLAETVRAYRGVRWVRKF